MSGTISEPNVSSQALASNLQAAEARHSSRCGICSHPQRRTIEHAFLHRTMSVSDIHQKFGVGHDAVYRHAHALNLLPTRNCNWRGGVQSDNLTANTTETGEVEKSENSVPHAEQEATPYARAMVELLSLNSDNQLLSAIEEAIEAKARDGGLAVDFAANQIYIAAALTKIRKQPDDWLTWFGSKGYEKDV